VKNRARVEPLYTERDVEKLIGLFQRLRYDHPTMRHAALL
jgi:hypothetical protein